jgi:hypothetical protein
MKKLFILLSIILVFQLPLSVLAADTTINNNGIINNGTINIQFNDTQPDWAREAIENMSKKGVVNGYEDGTFRPQNSITREEFAKMIAVTFGLNLSVTQDVYFTDVPADRWSSKFIAVAKDYLTGYYPPKGKAFFDPEAKATREDVAVALVKALGISTNPSIGAPVLTFKDSNKISSGLRSYIDTATTYNLISGYEDRTFRPQEPITRAEVAALLYRSIKSSVGDKTNTPASAPDVKLVQPTIQPTPNPAPNTPASNQSPTTVQPTINPPDLWADVVMFPGDPVTVRITGETNRDAQVYVNGKKIDVGYDGKFQVDKLIIKEGTYQFVIKSNYFNQVATVTKSIDVTIDAPQITLHDPNPVVIRGNPQISVFFNLKDKSDSYPILYVNDQKRSYSVGYSQICHIVLNLTQTGENDFTFKLVNKYGKESSTVTKAVYYDPK